MPWTRNLGTILLIVFLCCSAEAQNCATTAHWQVYGAPCLWVSDPVNVKRVDAVGYGHLYFSERPFSTGLCGDFKDGGVESLKIYPNRYGEYSNWPCMSQDCHTELEDIAGDEQSWIAVVDPAPTHADVVAALIAEAASPEIEPVLALIEERLEPSTGHDCIDDLDLVAKLFDVTTVVATKASGLVGINMSFARKAVSDDASTTACSGTLSCQVGQVLAHLMFQDDAASVPSVVAVAAAGNTAQQGFPSKLKHVIDAGAVDLTMLGGEGDAVRTAETPELGPGLRALMPASGLCLEDDDGKSWTVPSGSSNAAAIMTAWGVSALLHDPAAVEPLLAQPDLWRPQEQCTEDTCTYALAHGSTVVPTPGAGAGDVVVRALSDDLSQCGAWDPQDIRLELSLEPWSADPRLQHPTFLDLLASHHSMPSVVLCAPCSLEEEDREPSSPAQTSATGRAPAAWKAMNASWVIDLHSTLALAGQKEHRELYLRLGQDIYRLRSGKKDLTLDQLLALTEGHVSEIYISGGIDPGQLDDQPSLISVMEVELQGGGRELIHHSAPIVPQ